MDHYERFRAVLDAHPAGAPKSEAFKEILRLLFPGDEIKIALAMSFGLKTVEEITKRTDIIPGKVEMHLCEMADKGVVFCHQGENGLKYALVPTTSLCERTMQRSNTTPHYERLKILWKQYRSEGMVASVCGETTPLMRIIPVETEFAGKPYILPHEAVSNIIERSGVIAVSDCSCRVIEQRCSAPMETCFNFGSMAEFLIDRSMARRVSLEEALAILHETETAGLVHCSDNTTASPNKVCNCCPCCCLFLKGLLEIGNPNAVAASSFMAWIDDRKCTGCGLCHETRCLVDAITTQDGKAKVDAKRCIGCGLCASTCPTGAIILKKRQVHGETPATVKDMAMTVLTEKGKLDAFMHVMMR